MKKSKINLQVKCNKCGKSAPLDKEKSNSNWMVYKTKEPCECGGKFEFSFCENDEY